jgi:restriction endonuclease S subunit
MAAINIFLKSKLQNDLRLDAEFYHPKYVKLLNSLNSIGSKPLSFYNPKLNRGKLPDYKDRGDICVIKSAKVQDGFIEESDEFTNNEFIDKFKEAEVEYGDILVNSTGVGTLGRSAIMIKRDYKYVIDGHITKVSDIKQLSNFYVAIFLLSKYGRAQLDTMARGSSGQIEIYPEDIQSVIIPLLNKEIIKKIESLSKELYLKIENTKDYYKEAEEELLKKMNWEKINTSHVLNYTSNAKELLRCLRIDSEFYQPKFENLIKHLKKIGSTRLGDFCEIPNRGIQPRYFDTGEIIVINSKHLGPTEIDIENSERTNKEFFDSSEAEKSRLKKYDVLMYSTGAYIGRTNCYLEDKNAIGSNHVTIIRPNPKICNPVYLSLFLNSIAGLMQTDQRASGSAQREIYPQEIAEYKIFVPKTKEGKPDLEFQKKLADKVIKSYLAKKEAKEKLVEAKMLVEKEIERLIKQK